MGHRKMRAGWLVFVAVTAAAHVMGYVAAVAWWGCVAGFVAGAEWGRWRTVSGQQRGSDVGPVV